MSGDTSTGGSTSNQILKQLQDAFAAVEEQTKSLNESKEKHTVAETKFNDLAQQYNQLRQSEQSLKKKNLEMEQFISHQKLHIERTQKGFENEKQKNQKLQEQSDSYKKKFHLLQEELRCLRESEEANKAKLLRINIEKDAAEKARILCENLSKQFQEEASKEKDIFLSESKKLKRVLENQKQDIKEYKEKIKQKESEVVSLSEQAGKASSKNETLVKHLTKQKQEYHIIQKEHNKTRAQKVAQDSKLAELEEKIQEMNAEVESLSKKLSETERKKVKSEESSREIIKENILKLGKLNEEKAAEKAEYENLLHKLTSDLEEVRVKRQQELKQIHQQHKSHMELLSKKLTSLKNGFDIRTKELNEKSTQLESIKKDRSILRKKHEEVCAKLKAEETSHRAAKVQLSRISQQGDKLHREAKKSLHNSEAELAKTKALLQKCETNIKSLEQQLNDERSKIEQERLQYQAAKEQWKNAEGAIRKQIIELNTLLESEVKEKEDAQTQGLELKREFENRIKQLEKKLKEANKIHSSNKATQQGHIESLQENLNQYQAITEELEQVNSRLENEVVNLRDEVQSKTKELLALKDTVGDYEKKRDILQSERQSIQEELNQREIQMQEVKQEYEKQKRLQSQKVTVEQQEYHRKLHAAESVVRILRKDLENSKEELAEKVIIFSQKSKVAAQELARVQEDNSRIEAELKLQTRKYNTVATSLEEMKARFDKNKKEAEAKCKQLENEIFKANRNRDEKAMQIIQTQQNFEEERRQLISQTQKDSEETHNALEGMKWRVDSLTRELELSKTENESMLQKIKRLEKENIEMKEDEVNLIGLYKNMTTKKKNQDTDVYEETRQSNARAKLDESDQVFRSVPDFIKYKRSSSMNALNPEDHEKHSPEDERMQQYVTELLGRDSSGGNQEVYNNQMLSPKSETGEAYEEEYNWTPKQKVSTKRSKPKRTSTSNTKTKNKMRPQSARIRKSLNR